MKRGYDLPKRLIDVVAAGAGLVLVSPLLLAAAVAIRLEDGGPALFRQIRAGRGRRPFRIFKFRSMVVDADRLLDASGKPTGQRVTRVGKLLRFTSLDELPQLLNVLLGDMSLVGPRPGLPEQAERYDATQLRRFEVRPGLTGLAQVKGRNTLKWSERLRYDVEYVDGRSLWLDLRILIATVRVVLLREGVVLDRNAGFADDLPAAGAKASAPAQPDAVSSGLVPLAEADAWDRLVKRCLHWDVYHLAAYHRVAAVTDGGEPFLFWFEADGATACVPFLRRPIDPSLAGDRARFDASSAYGYPGPIASCSEAPNATWRGALQDHFRKALSDAGIVAAFIRHESRAADIWLVDGLGETLEAGPTVMLDLAGSDEDRAARLGQKHRYEVRRAERDGLRVVEASEDEDYEAFAGLYGATMERLGATAYYRFPLDYFFKLRDALGDHLRLLFTVDASGERLAGALFFLTPGIVQYHLSGRKAGPEATFAMRPLLDAGAKLGAGQGARWMHLGGGLGGRQDGLFAFKASVTGGRSRFLTTRWIVDPAGYAAICERAVRIRGGAGDPSFFPAYRAPVRKDP